MKKVILATVLSATVSISANAAMEKQGNFKFVGDTQYASFCKAVLNDNVKLFKRSLNRFVGPLGTNRKIVLERVLDDNNVQCAGQGIVEFSQQRNASKVAAYLSKAQA